MEEFQPKKNKFGLYCFVAAIIGMVVAAGYAQKRNLEGKCVARDGFHLVDSSGVCLYYEDEVWKKMQRGDHFQIDLKKI